MWNYTFGVVSGTGMKSSPSWPDFSWGSECRSREQWGKHTWTVRILWEELSHVEFIPCSFLPTCWTQQIIKDCWAKGHESTVQFLGSSTWAKTVTRAKDLQRDSRLQKKEMSDVWPKIYESQRDAPKLDIWKGNLGWRRCQQPQSYRWNRWSATFQGRMTAAEALDGRGNENGTKKCLLKTITVCFCTQAKWNVRGMFYTWKEGKIIKLRKLWLSSTFTKKSNP